MIRDFSNAGLVNVKTSLSAFKWKVVLCVVRIGFLILTRLEFLHCLNC